MYVYQKSEPGLWTVGFYHPDGDWEAESDHDNKETAAERVAWLNGSGKPDPVYDIRVGVTPIDIEDLKLDGVYPDDYPPKVEF